MFYKKLLTVVCVVLVGLGIFTLFGADVQWQGDKVSIEKHIDLIRTATPDAPPTGYGRLYVDANNKLYFKDDNGIQYLLSHDVGPGPVNPNGVVVCVTSSNSYTVPTGKALFICTAVGSGQYLTINWETYSQDVSTFASYSSPLVVPAGKTVRGYSGEICFTGYEIEAEGVAMKVTFSSGYTVPAGKVLFLGTIRGGAGSSLTIDGRIHSPALSDNGFYCYSSPLVVPAGKTVRTYSGEIYFTGYLKDAGY